MVVTVLVFADGQGRTTTGIAAARLVSGNQNGKGGKGIFDRMGVVKGTRDSRKLLHLIITQGVRGRDFTKPSS